MDYVVKNKPIDKIKKTLNKIVPLNKRVENTGKKAFNGINRVVVKSIRNHIRANKVLAERERKLKRINDLTDKSKSSLLRMVGGTAALIAANKAADKASDMIETQNKFNVVFGETTEKANLFFESYANNMGFSQLKTKEFAGDIQNLLTGFGTGREESFEMSKSIIQLANDLDSFNNLTSRGIDVQKTMMSALMGESQAAKTLGASILEPQLQVAALTLGYDKYTNKLSENEKIQIRLRAITMQSKDAIGDVSRNLDTQVGTRRRLLAVAENYQILLGTKLLPLQVKLFQVGIDLIDMLTRLTNWMSNGTLASEAFIAVTKGIIVVVALYKAWTVAQIALNVAMNANPIGLIVVGIGVLVGAVIFLVQNWDLVKNKMIEVWDIINNNPFLKLLSYLNPVTQAIRAIIIGFKAIKKVMQYLDGKNGSHAIIEDVKVRSETIDGGVDGSHANGLGYVPKDGYIAELHKGERVLTAQENKTYNQGNVTVNVNTSNVDYATGLKQFIENKISEFNESYQNTQLSKLGITEVSY